jgi:4-hydroxybenzoate polyprenyltransferase
MTGLAQAAPADADSRNWVDRFAPGPAKPYLRLMRADRPIGTWLLLIPCFWGLALGSFEGAERTTAARYALLFAVGAIVMRGAGCAYNDIVDKDFDGKVARTALRPIPSGQISLRQAWMFLGALALVGLVALLQFNPFTIYLGLASLLLVAAYPFMKRITWWPQAWLGLTFNWGALMGYAALAGEVSASALSLYAAGICWTLGYDTIYAHQDKEDDALVGVKSSALALSGRTRPAIAVFYAGTIALFAATGAASGASWLFFAALAPAALHFALQTRKLDISDSSRCLTIFKSNRDAGFLLLAPLLLETVFRSAS